MSKTIWSIFKSFDLFGYPVAFHPIQKSHKTVFGSVCTFIYLSLLIWLLISNPELIRTVQNLIPNLGGDIKPTKLAGTDTDGTFLPTTSQYDMEE